MKEVENSLTGRQMEVPTFNWDKENSFWFNKNEETLNFVNVLKTFMTGKKVNLEFHNPAKRKDLFISTIGEGNNKKLLFTFVRNTPEGDKVKESIALTPQELTYLTFALDLWIKEATKNVLNQYESQQIQIPFKNEDNSKFNKSKINTKKQQEPNEQIEPIEEDDDLNVPPSFFSDEED
jgi:hypothetical protein